MSKSVKRKVFLLLFSILALAGLNWYATDQANPIYLTKKIEREIGEYQAQFDVGAQLLQNEEDTAGKQTPDRWSTNLTNRLPNLNYFVFQDDSLVFWSTNHFVPGNELIYILPLQKDTVVKLANGYYLARKIEITKEGRNTLALFFATIYINYPIENSFLRNGFSEDLLASDPKVNFDSSGQTGTTIYDRNGVSLFAVDFAPNQTTPMLLSVLTLLTLMLVLAFLYALGRYSLSGMALQRPSKTWMAIGFYVVVALGIRVAASLLLPFLCVRNAAIFNNFYFGFLLPSTSFGALLLDVQMLWAMAVTLFLMAKPVGKPNKKWLRFLAVSVLFLLLYSSYIFVINQLIYHAADQLSYAGLFRFDLESYLAFALVSALTLTFFILTKKIFSLLLFAGDQMGFLVLVYIPLALLFFLLWDHLLPHQWIPFATGSLLLVLFVLQVKFGDSRFGISVYVWFLLLFSFLLTDVFYEISAKRSDSEQELTAFKLGLESDPMFEYLYSDLAREIKADTSLISLMQDENQEADIRDENLVKYLKNRHIKGYFDRYNLTITICRPEEELMIQPENYLTSCADYFDGIARSFGTAVADSSLFYMDDNLLGPYYLAKIVLPGNATDTLDFVNLYLEFYFKYIPEGLGYPELLIDQSKGFTRDFSNYSFANYQDSLLVYKFGNYLYPPRLQEMTQITEGFYNDGEYRHYNYLLSSKRMLVVSKPSQKLIELISPFSYFVFFLGVIGVLLIGFGLRQNSNWFSQTMSFRFKLQLLILSALGVSFAVIGITSVFFISNLYSQKNDDFLAERTRSILIELEHKMKNESLDDPGITDYLYEILNKFSLVFFSDINLYDLEGRLLATSRPEIFDKNLLSRRMNPEAYENMKEGRSLFYLHQEKIGDGTYYSSYIPFRDSDGKLRAYLNLPYFARESELRNEISAFLLTYVNIFILLTGLSALLMLLLSRRLTLPLQMIQTKMKEVRIDQTNEPILWKGNDEIGQLVKQYNQLISELARSADLLARSERESAWREMAKQVAHEIKNPLTPMRLSVQYLQRAWDENDPEIDKKVRQTTQTLVEQIDTLNAIASAFSDFARMPVNNPEQFDIVALLRRIIVLYNEAPNVKIVLHLAANEPCLVVADQKNMGRALGNLLKNALQAIGNKKDGLIEIFVQKTESHIEMTLTDNGKGMTETEQKKVFTPNFTTKSSGMGVGLSIVHNIVKAAGGSISFRSEPGIGTSFTLILPVSRDDQTR